MIINQYQPIEELTNLFEKKQYQDIDIILNTLGEHFVKIETDEISLGQIHHAMNIDQYAKKEFRKKLFERIPPSIQKQYFAEYGMLSEKYEDAIRKTVCFEWGCNKETENFVNFFKYPQYLIPMENDVSKQERYKMLFDFQFRVVFDVLKILENQLSRVLIQMPTGTGKTRTAMEIITRLLNSQENIQIVWFANKSELLDQAHDVFVQLWNHVGKSDVKVIKLWGEDSVSSIPDGNVILFAGYQKFIGMNLKVNPNYVFLDEAHQILAPTYDKALESIISFQKQTRVVGLSATPGRGISKVQNERLVHKFHENIVTIRFDDEDLDEQYENNIVEYLEDQKILARAEPEALKTDYEYDLTEEEWKHLTKLVDGDHPEHSVELMKKLANDNLRNVKIIDALKRYADEGKKILYFGVDKLQSKMTYVILQQLGVKAIHIDGDTDKTFRRQIVENFKNSDDINVICNYDLFTTGFDVPNLDVVFIARPVNSPVLFNQIVGRGTRGPKMGSKKESFTLVQVIDKIRSSFIGFDPYEQYGFWDKHWKA